jgi:hypothetical protein
MSDQEASELNSRALGLESPASKSAPSLTDEKTKKDNDNKIKKLLM